jgi:drug/metabolite transporter (DMT)-like permease
LLEFALAVSRWLRHVPNRVVSRGFLSCRVCRLALIIEAQALPKGLALPSLHPSAAAPSEFVTPAATGHAGSAHPLMPVLGLLIAATSWGVIWYPYRAMEAAGLPAPVATFFSYLVAMVFALAVFPKAIREFRQYPLSLAIIGLTAGVTNVAYLVAIMEAEVVRVVLLFYLAPLWTVLLARVLLSERIDRRGALTIIVAMAGAVIMLWRPELGAPLPKNAYEWLGMLGGFCFALCNVLVRREHRATPEAKSIAGAAGVALVALPVALVLVSTPMLGWPALAADHVLLLVVVGVALISGSVAMQYGLSKMAANRAAVILLFELIIAAIAAHYLASEVSRAQEWVGGVLLAAAGLVAAMGTDKMPRPA